jgi:hypothetical protein
MLSEYIHNFACWSAARAVQNPNNWGTKTVLIKSAIEKVNLSNYVSNPELLTNYKLVHHQLILKLNKELNWDLNKHYGVLSKILAIYFKVTIIIPNNAPELIKNLVYPPIDSINILKIGLGKKYKWTKINEEHFNEIIDLLEKHCLTFNMSFIEFESKNKLHY